MLCCRPSWSVPLCMLVLRSGGKNKCVELSAQVIFKARFFFSKFNYEVTNQARCRLAITIASTGEIQWSKNTARYCSGCAFKWVCIGILSD